MRVRRLIGIREEGQGVAEFALMLVLVGIVVIVVLALTTDVLDFMSGIGELFTKKKPYSPRVYYEDIEAVVIQDIGVNSIKTADASLFDKESRIAIYSFRSPEDTQGGILVSDAFASLLRNAGYEVFERDEVERILSEQQLMVEGRVALSDLDIANRLGKLESVDYMVFGAVTLYRSQGQAVFLPIKLREDDKEDYVEAYNDYRDWYINGPRPFSLDHWTLSPAERSEKLRAELGVLSWEELEEKIKETSKQEFHTIASLGVSAKIVDVRTGEIVWMGQAETNDFTLVNGANRIVREFLESILD